MSNTQGHSFDGIHPESKDSVFGTKHLKASSHSLRPTYREVTACDGTFPDTATYLLGADTPIGFNSFAAPRSYTQAYTYIYTRLASAHPQSSKPLLRSPHSRVCACGFFRPWRLYGALLGPSDPPECETGIKQKFRSIRPLRDRCSDFQLSTTSWPW